jgi:hypothetical protein
MEHVPGAVAGAIIFFILEIALWFIFARDKDDIKGAIVIYLRSASDKRSSNRKSELEALRAWYRGIGAPALFPYLVEAFFYFAVASTLATLVCLSLFVSVFIVDSSRLLVLKGVIITLIVLILCALYKAVREMLKAKSFLSEIVASTNTANTPVGELGNVSPNPTPAPNPRP